MARLARLKYETVPANGAWYHLYASTAAHIGEFPLERDGAKRRLLEIIRFYARAYRLSLGAAALMGNHYHIVVRMEEYRELPHEELFKAALKMYPNSAKQLQLWSPKKWERFGKRIFDISEFMRNVQAAFARWYNRRFERKGRFWADRFKSTLLTDKRALLDCMLYVDLNPVRAGLAEKPEDYDASTLFFREMRDDDWLVPLEKIFGEEPELSGTKSTKQRKEKAFELYKSMAYYRGAVPTKATHKIISDELIAREEQRGFKRSGVYRKKLRYFTDGLVLGSKEFVGEQIIRLRERGDYLRRRNPIEQSSDQPEDDAYMRRYTLREQRSNFIPV